MKKIEYATYKKPSDFMHFDKGETEIRIISSGGLSKKHGMKTANGFIPLGECTEDETCENCKKENVAKNKWTWIIYSAKLQEVKVMDVGSMVGDAICKIAKEKGDPQEYNLIISKSGQGLQTKYYVRIGGKSEYVETPDIKNKKMVLIKKYFIK